MKEFKGTNGKWFSSGTEIVSMPSQVKISNRISGVSYEEAKANAKLIAAAPDLLEALKELLFVCQHPEDLGLAGIDAAANAQSAINKALGE